MRLQLALATETTSERERHHRPIRQAKIGVYQAESQLRPGEDRRQRDLEAQLDAGDARRPDDGIVTAVNIVAGRRCPDRRRDHRRRGDYEVTAEVVESDIAPIKLQQPATVTVGAIGADLDGTVTAIAPDRDARRALAAASSRTP